MNDLFRAIQSNNLSSVQLILNTRRTDINLVDLHKNTALHIACRLGNKSIVDFLLSTKIDIHAVNKYGNTALHLAISKGHIDLAFALILKGADINAKNTCGETPLDLATKEILAEINKKLNEQREIYYGEINKLLCDYLKHLCSSSFSMVAGEKVYFKGQSGNNYIEQEDIRENLNNKTAEKFDKLCMLLIKLKKADGSFEILFNDPETEKVLSKHRDNIAIRILKAITYILSGRFLFSQELTLSSKGAKVVSQVKNYNSSINFFTPSNKDNESHPSQTSDHSLGR